MTPSSSSTKRAPLRVGDRVAAYSHMFGGPNRLIGVVTHANKNYVQVDTDDGVKGRGLHPKQCRRLRPKAKRREIWISAPDLPNILRDERGREVHVWPREPAWEAVLFREVRPTKSKMKERV